ncbi:tetratricopeptide repeat protein [Falsiroseomonas selenitidurans]|uniref:Tetratricopeptide repeat protein 38 n=1 Tax=Falsiroseomonas selenitidurans TaxID=2716335 RepID=A0ABX1DY92_9PROT|nr:tetratricopeptide repeat protein [Falsiroseomonas selenitidurans]NKC29879.1 tetratricopeptide repeat protein [Falsiroseomonas selenitidurans]
MRDGRGLELTTTAPAAVAALESAVTALLAHRADLGTHLQHCFAADSGLVAARCLAGFANLAQARQELHGPALAHLGAARGALRQRGGTAREAALADALAEWAIRGDMQAAATRLEGVLRADPLDAMTLKLAHGLRFMLGDAPAMRLAVESALPAWNAATPGHGYILGCHAFALEETGEAAAAERQGRRAVAAAPDDLWGAHAVAHVMERSGRARQGLAWIAELGPRLPQAGAFGRHIHWHAALFHLHLGQAEAALALFDGQVAGAPSEDVRDFANAASLLWRLEAQGVPVGARRWAALADVAARSTAAPGLAFIDLHHVLALGAAGREADLAAKLAAMRERALAETDSQARVVARLGLPAAQGIAAALRGDAPEAVALLLPLRQAMPGLGGSDAQRDLFERLLIQASLQAGQRALATLLLRDRAGQRALGAWEARCAGAARPSLAA